MGAGERVWGGHASMEEVEKGGKRVEGHGSDATEVLDDYTEWPGHDTFDVVGHSHPPMTHQPG